MGGINKVWVALIHVALIHECGINRVCDFDLFCSNHLYVWQQTIIIIMFFYLGVISDLVWCMLYCMILSICLFCCPSEHLPFLWLDGGRRKKTSDSGLQLVSLRNTITSCNKIIVQFILMHIRVIIISSESAACRLSFLWSSWLQLDPSWEKSMGL